jgi:AcrR family transcriptional regulator
MATRQSPAPSTAPTPRKKRRPHRREEILEAAVELFHRNGYHATGMDAIGATAGITGPAIYRHFKSKEDILETLLVEVSAATLATAQRLAAEADTPAEALRTLVEFSADSLLDNPELSYVAQYERRTLPRKSRVALDKAERLYFEAWVQPLMEVRPELSEAEARVIVHAAAGLAVAAAIYKSGLEHNVAKDLIVAMMTNALMVPRRRVARQRRAG